MIDDVQKRARIKHYLEERTEVDFMKEVLQPLFDNMEFSRVRFNHGPGELGRDFILAKTDELLETNYTVVVVKNDHIRNTNKSEKEILTDVMRQVEQAEGMQVEEFKDLPKKLPLRVWVFTSGNFSTTAETEIRKHLKYVSKSNISFVDQDKLVALISQHNPSFFKHQDPFASQYLSSLKNKIRQATSEDIASSGILGKVEVNCRRVQVEEPTKNTPQAFKYEKVLNVFIKEEQFWIKGGFGSGKSYTLVQYIEYLEGLNQKLDSGPVPFPIYIKCQFKDKIDAETVIASALKEHINSYSEDDFKRILKDYPLLIIVDEFEKIIHKNGPELVEEIEKYLKSKKLKHKFRLGIMSREFTAFNKSSLSGFVPWSIVDTGFNQLVDKFRVEFVEKNPERYKKYKDLMKDGMLKRIPKTPLALNILYQVFSAGFEKSPQNLYEFFDLYFQIVLGRWNKQLRDASKATDYSQVRPLLEELAYTMCENDDECLDIAFVLKRINKYLKDIGDLKTDRDGYLEILARDSEIITLETGHFCFKDRVYKEFLAGCYVAKHYWKKDFIIENVLDPVWQEPIIFAAGMKNKDNELLGSLHKIKVADIDDKFSKLRVISLLTQALYHSDDKEKIDSIKASLDLVVDIRDDKNLAKLVKQKHSFSEDFFHNVLVLGAYNTFYSRNTLLLPLSSSISLVDNRRKSYVIAALSSLEIPPQIVDDVTEAVEEVKKDTSFTENMALGVILKSNSKVGYLAPVLEGKVLTTLYKKSVKSVSKDNFITKKKREGQKRKK
jgi:hypothetical protein